MRDAHCTYAARKLEEAAKAKRIQQKKDDAAKKKAEEKELYEKAEQKRDRLDEREKTLDKDMEKANEEFHVAQELLRTASISLSEAINERNMTRIAAASELMSAAQRKYDQFAGHKEVQDNIRNEIGKKRENAFDVLLKIKKHT